MQSKCKNRLYEPDKDDRATLFGAIASKRFIMRVINAFLCVLEIISMRKQMRMRVILCNENGFCIKLDKYLYKLKKFEMRDSFIRDNSRR